MFKFKEFTVHQDKAAMKIGTDGVLLGAWVSIESYPDSVLDIGSGTGLLSLMLAQRSDAMTIDAVEIEENAYEQTVDNFELSDWGDRLFCYNASFQDFYVEMNEEEEVYDLIISNPPYHTETVKSSDKSKALARSIDSLSFEELLKGVSLLLSDVGLFSVIIPFKESENFLNLANKVNLFPKRICNVKGTCDSEYKRTMFEFCKSKQDVVISDLVIEINRHHYTDEYIELTKDFYLKM